ncbi:Predicted ATP-dependent endonuclease of the OLD family, contains P-loop ATPase and TOPRIM domains [Pseudorhodobacter antarcticus]|uniref:Predicted ATP-dependent endonuclease of the OLD family, contains P-loop ATPase and TOPRIM domains n=1 Tax=Pseudorhodobacter antarcticus TaxID=1077947 RepID=A0A1H8KIW7_9RHOB|nr:ATP-dependent endonuclease [Pseudorhodobacter antarcticus]SEN92842.1 Predicted ATP-dependent endonuclease of the OLD family, contains P-loop ATPase and TOPRIM domains [Pseudorhodobacter antarcticus]
MYLHSYRLKNYRRLRDVRVELASDISIFVGANNSGKTSATQAIIAFLSGAKGRFSLFDFSSHTWKELNALGEANDAEDANATIPAISLDLWFRVTEADLYLVIPILPSTAWAGSKVGIRIEFAAKNPVDLLERYRLQKQTALAQAAALPEGAGAYVPWPKSLTDFLEKELQSEFELRYFVLDDAQFDDNLVENEGYVPAIIGGEPSGATILKSLVRVDCLNAQRHLADPSSRSEGGSGRSEDLSRRLSRFYQRNLEQREEDHSALKALFESEVGLNKHLMDVFAPTLDRIATLGYPGLHNPKLEIISALNPASVMSQDARIHYVLGDGEQATRLPDSYNGLGFKNLIYMVVEILDLQAKWFDEEEKRPPLHLIFIEEPEAHLHAQLQQVFIRNVLGLLARPGEEEGIFSSQVVITTHSPHILYERGFAPIRYFRRHVVESEQSTQVLNLSAFQAGDAPKDRDFLQRYLKLTHCDLFFADAAILVEGNVERLLMPLMIEKEASTLRSTALCILEVGGAFGHRFKELIEFLGVTTLLITDIDSVTAAVEPAPVDGDNEDEEIEFEIPGAAGAPASKRYGKACLTSTEGAETSNQTLIQWLPKKRFISELLIAGPEDKVADLVGSETAKVMVTYQVATDVTWAGHSVPLCGRTLEEAFGLENATWCQANEQRIVGLKLRNPPADASALAGGLHKRVGSSGFDKTKFALQVLASEKDAWATPRYIRDGLVWLAKQVSLEVEQEAEAIVDAALAADGAVE